MNHHNKFKTYFYSSLVLCAITITMYVICFIVAFDTPISYFSARSLLPYIAKYMLILTTGWILSVFIQIPQSGTLHPYPQHSAFSRITSALTFIAFVIYSVLKILNNSTSVSKISLACIILAAISSVVFLINSTSATISNNTRALLYIPVIIWATLSMTEAYSYQYITMNSPIKILLMLSMMSVMFVYLYEARYSSSCSYPRAYTAFLLIGMCMCSVFSLPFIIILLSGTHSVPAFLPTAILSLSFAIHITSRAFDNLNSLQSHKESQINQSKSVKSSQPTQEENSDVS